MESTEAVSERHEIVVVTEHCPDRPYIELQIPADLMIAQSIKFTVSSRDQGWTFENNDFASWTWFQAHIYRPYDRNNLAHVHLFDNRKAYPDFCELTQEFSEAWVKALRPGDIVELLPRAMYAGWLNVIQYAKIELHYQKKVAEYVVPLDLSNLNKGLYARRLNGRELRILTILPGPDDSPIRCEMKCIALEADSQYDALSYCWGDRQTALEIEVRLDGDFQKFYVSQSAYNALKHLRGRESLTLWVDAICINQNDELEKAQQVSMMASVFAKAQTVHVWLGINQADEFALCIMRDIHNLVRRNCEGGQACSCRGIRHTKVSVFDIDETQQITRETRNLAITRVYEFHRKESLGKLKADHVSKLMSHSFENEWFRRVWVLQEVKRARNVLVHCSRTIAGWDDLDVVSKWMDDTTFTDQNPNVEVSLERIPSVWRTLSADDSSQILHVLSSSLDLKATDGRDKIFAILSFGRETSQNLHSLIKPDYTKDIDIVFADFTRWWILEHGSLAILSYIHGHRSRTWLRITQDRSHTFQGPTWAFPRDGRPNWAEATLGYLFQYRATKNLTVDSSWIQDQNSKTQKKLKLMGYRVARIETIAHLGCEERFQGKDIYYARFLEAMYGVIDPANSHQHWKTRKVAGSLRGNYETRLHLHMYGHAEIQMDKRHINPLGTGTGKVRSFSGDCADAFCFRAMNGMYGLCPWRAKLGDLIVILLGGNVPFVLRGVGEAFELVWECFVMGIMNGQFMEKMQKQDKNPELFSLI